ncbi:MAG: phosphonate ABC transporter, permease protein PhnE [Symbiobacteriaceae bacterium]|nr:phosphonate ABC transporter, permease protein PhnE [Symbiobacteriaceae bacterium]
MAKSNESSISTGRTPIAHPDDRRNVLVFALTVGILFTFATWYTGFNPFTSLLEMSEFGRFITQDFLPPRVTNMPGIMAAMMQTIYLALAASGTAMVLSLLWSFCGSTAVIRNKSILTLARSLASVIRNIPALIWTYILVFSFGIGTHAGYLALTLSSTGFLTRSFMETLDEVAAENLEALRATGASTPAVIAQAIIPAAMPGLVSWFLYSVELNIRTSTILGLVGAGGVGLLMMTYIKQFNYAEASFVIFVVAVATIVVNLLIDIIRKKVLA